MNKDKIETDKILSRNRLAAGVDEAGRGCLAGPVVAAAVILDLKDPQPIPVEDSKKLSPSEREVLAGIIKRKAISYCIYPIGWKTIDKFNIRKATELAMINALKNLKVRPEIALVDGNMKFNIPDIEIIPIIKGDAKSYLIAAASILAKVTRDSLMRRYHNLFPVYNFAKNKGYPTREHKRAIAENGLCKIHRRTFKFK